LSELVKLYIYILKGAKWLCLFNNSRVTAQQVQDKLQNSYKVGCILEQVTECLDFYASIGGCSVYRDGVNVYYNLINDMDDSKKILFKDGISFLYAKDKDTATECYGHLKAMKIESLTPVC